jgi:hypothetical protein
MVLWFVTPCGSEKSRQTASIFTAEQYAEHETRGNLLLAILFHPEDGGVMFLPNVGTTRRYNSSYSPL